MVKRGRETCRSLLFVVLGAGMSPGQDLPAIPLANIPRLPPSAVDIRGFVPSGWKVQAQSAGDLNGDGRPDLVFVLHETDSKLVLHNGDFGTRELDTNPRILAAAFAQPKGGYKLAAQNSTLIPRWIRPNQDDNFGDGGSLRVARGAFTVKLHYFSSSGGWNTGDTAFTFRWRNSRFELIGVDNDNVTRNTGDDTRASVNYATGRAQVTTGSISGGPPRKSRGFALPGKPLRTLDDVGDGMEFVVPGAD